ncbi:MAG: SpoIID/LytB domain-containing protein [Prochloraceae cyanobacterium]|nr:SpoIID/LytB domain-containing protein [Prochloraceae cyanobacterium]
MQQQPQIEKQSKHQTLIRLSFAIIAKICLLGIQFTQTPAALAEDVELSVGIVQRFGAEAKDLLIIESYRNSLLNISFNNPNPTTIKTNKIVLEILMQPLEVEAIDEKVILSDRSTFETAEDSAKNWQELGIQVEVTQPGRWQVWAKRDVYNTPILRRWLLDSLKKQGYTQPYLQTTILKEKPVVSAIVDADTYPVRELTIQSDSDRIFVTVDNKRFLYGGSLKLQPNAYGNFTLVNLVPLETYLRGVVPYEIGASAPQNAIEAQSIIARTYALRNLRRFAVDNYQLCATVHCQVYKGLVGATPRTDRAIAITKGLVLTYQNQLIDALYSSTSGGVTAPFGDTWNGDSRSYLKAKIDSTKNIWNLSQYSLESESNFRRFINLKAGFNETGFSLFRWNKASSIADLNDDFRKYLETIKHPLAEFETIESMAVSKRSKSGRILNFTVTTNLGKIVLHKNEVRSAFSPPRSTLFYLDPVRDDKGILTGYKFIGGGFGHGVGLSQRGSYKLARLGWPAARILKFYYPGTTIETINDSLVFWQESN